MEYKVSVIIPVYGVEGFIGKCAETLMRQTLKDVEYVFVDDATKDHSMDVLRSVVEAHPERKPHVRIIKHGQNKGLPAARNTGLKAATGEYIFHCDSDDFLETDALENLYNAAKENDADIVWCDYFEVLPTMELRKSQPSLSTSMEAVKAMLQGRMEYNVWNKLAKRELYTENGISFPDGLTMGEDLTMVMLFACATRVAYVPCAAYHYVRVNPSAVTRGMTREKTEALISNVHRMENFLVSRFGHSLDDDIASLKLNQKWPLLITDSQVARYKEWNDWFPEANDYIKKQEVSSRIKIVEYAAWKKQYWFVWLHYWIVIRLYYSVTGIDKKLSQ